MGKKTERRVKSLEKAIGKWISNNCESYEDIWIKNWWGDKSTELMARAAIAVMEAIDEVQEYTLTEGFLFSEQQELP